LTTDSGVYPDASTGIRMAVDGFEDAERVGDLILIWYVAFKGHQNNIG